MLNNWIRPDAARMFPKNPNDLSWSIESLGKVQLNLREIIHVLPQFFGVFSSLLPRLIGSCAVDRQKRQTMSSSGMKRSFRLRNALTAMSKGPLSGFDAPVSAASVETVVFLLGALARLGRTQLQKYASFCAVRRGESAHIGKVEQSGAAWGCSLKEETPCQTSTMRPEQGNPALTAPLAALGYCCCCLSLLDCWRFLASSEAEQRQTPQAKVTSKARLFLQVPLLYRRPQKLQTEQNENLRFGISGGRPLVLARLFVPQRVSSSYIAAFPRSALPC